MVKLKRSQLAAEARRRNQDQLARLGGEIRRSRLRRGRTQAGLASLLGLGRSTISALELGRGGGHTLDTWQRLAIALDRLLRIELGRDPLDSTVDAGHLAVQELETTAIAA